MSMNSESSHCRILLSDDHPVVLDGLKTLFGTVPQYEVVGEAETTEKALELAQSLQPQVMVIDLNLPSNGGMDVLAKLKQSGSTTKAIVFSMHDDEVHARHAYAAGAHAYVVKNSPTHVILQALQKVSEGEYYYPAQFQYLSPDARSKPTSDGEHADPLARLSKREREIFFLIADGLPNRVIAKKFFLSPRTVETHRARIIKKLGCGSTSDLIRYALRHRLLSL